MSPKRTRRYPVNVTSFQLADICALVGAKRSQVEYWTKLGLVTPSVEVGKGTGNFRSFGLVELLEFAIAVRLNKFPVSTKLIGIALNRFREFHDQARAINRGLTQQQIEAGWHAHYGMRWDVLFSDAQREGIADALAAAMVRRDRLEKTKGKSHQQYRRTVLAQVAALNDVEQRQEIVRAFRWWNFCRGQETRRLLSEEDGSFFWVAAYADQGDAAMLTEDIRPRDMVIDSATIVNLEVILNQLENKLETWPFAAMFD